MYWRRNSIVMLAFVAHATSPLKVRTSAPIWGRRMMVLLLESSATLALSALLVVLLRRICAPLNLVDLPDHRKIHEGAVPLCGGIAIFLSFSGIGLLTPNFMGLGPGFWSAMLLVVGLGVVDDRFALPARFRFVVQVAIAAALIATEGLGQVSLGDLLPAEIDGSHAALIVVSVAFVVGLINAWNMVDGVDGLAGGSAAAALVWILLLSLHKGEEGLAFPVATLLAAVGGFLIFNIRSPWRARASVYLGDAGSTTLGAIIAYLILRLADSTGGLPFPSLLWLVIVPVVRRMLDHRSPMSADRRHLHHLLIDSGISPAATSYIIVLFSFLCGGIGYLGILLDVPEFMMLVGLLFVAMLHTAFVLAIEGLSYRRTRRVGQTSVKLQM